MLVCFNPILGKIWKMSFKMLTQFLGLSIFDPNLGYLFFFECIFIIFSLMYMCHSHTVHCVLLVACFSLLTHLCFNSKTVSDCFFSVWQPQKRFREESSKSPDSSFRNAILTSWPTYVIFLWACHIKILSNKISRRITKLLGTFFPAGSNRNKCKTKQIKDKCLIWKKVLINCFQPTNIALLIKKYIIYINIKHFLSLFHCWGENKKYKTSNYREKNIYLWVCDNRSAGKQVFNIRHWLLGQNMCIVWII